MRTITLFFVLAMLVPVTASANDLYGMGEHPDRQPASQLEADLYGLESIDTDPIQWAEALDQVPGTDQFLAGIVPRVQEPVCINGVCYPPQPTMTVVTATPQGIPPNPVPLMSTVSAVPMSVTPVAVCPHCGRVKTVSRMATVSTTNGVVMTQASLWQPVQYGLFGQRARPLFWRVRPLLRARMGW